MLVGQAFAGHADFNQQQVTEGLEPISLGRYLTSASFGVDVAENWQSEYLQFFLYIFLTVWLVQKGLPGVQAARRGRPRVRPGAEGRPVRRTETRRAGPATRGLRRALFSNSLGLVMGLIFLASWLAQSIAGVAAFNEQQLSRPAGPGRRGRSI